MEIAKVFQYANCQAVSLPDRYKFTCDEVAVQQLDSSLILTPKDKAHNSLLFGEACRTKDNKHISDSTILKTERG